MRVNRRVRVARAGGVGRQLGDRALAERGQNPLAHPPQRIAHVAFRELLARALRRYEQAVTVTGPSIAWITSATEICAGTRAS